MCFSSKRASRNRLMPCTDVTRCSLDWQDFNVQRLSNQNSLFWLDLITSLSSTAGKKQINSLSVVSRSVIYVWLNLWWITFSEHTKPASKFRILMVWNIHHRCYSCFMFLLFANRSLLKFSTWSFFKFIFLAWRKYLRSQDFHSPPVTWLYTKLEAWGWSYG